MTKKNTKPEPTTEANTAPSPEARVTGKGLLHLAKLEGEDLHPEVDWSSATPAHASLLEAQRGLGEHDERRARHAEALAHAEAARSEAAAAFEKSERSEDFEHMSSATTEGNRARFLLEKADAQREAHVVRVSSAQDELDRALDRCVMAALANDEQTWREEEQKLAQTIVDHARAIDVVVELMSALDERQAHRRAIATRAIASSGAPLPPRRSASETVRMLIGFADFSKLEGAILRLLDAHETSTHVEQPIYKARYEHEGDSDYQITDEGGVFSVVDVTQEALHEQARAAAEHARTAAERAEAQRVQAAKEAALERGKKIYKQAFEEAQARVRPLLDCWVDEYTSGADDAAKEAAAAVRDDFLEQAGVGRLDYRSREYRERYTAREIAANAAWDASYRSNAPSDGRVGAIARMNEESALNQADHAWARVWKRNPVMIPERRYRPTSRSNQGIVSAHGVS